ncbi:hypothetical protein DFJ74DRAFT_4960 [Hyaloraphidium curvatum]|nr:hypothetical protein DFJ74DRAFT_4960 [Hyaloraphidium curvatum]
MPAATGHLHRCPPAASLFYLLCLWSGAAAQGRGRQTAAPMGSGGPALLNCHVDTRCCSTRTSADHLEDFRSCFHCGERPEGGIAARRPWKCRLPARRVVESLGPAAPRSVGQALANSLLRDRTVILRKPRGHCRLGASSGDGGAPIFAGHSSPQPSPSPHTNRRRHPPEFPSAVMDGHVAVWWAFWRPGSSERALDRRIWAPGRPELGPGWGRVGQVELAALRPRGTFARLWPCVLFGTDRALRRGPRSGVQLYPGGQNSDPTPHSRPRSTFSRS